MVARPPAFMSPMSDNQSVFDPDAILDVLDGHAVRYVVIGSMSDRMHGVDRFTQDLDVCVSIRAPT